MGAFHEAELGGETRRFRLAIGELRELQEKCDAGPATILARLVSFQPQVAGRGEPNPDDFGGVDSDEYRAEVSTYSILRSIGGDWRINDIREPIRLGLIGGGMTPSEVSVVMARYVDQIHKYPLVEHRPLAVEILMHAIMPEPDDPVGKPVAETETKPTATAS